MRFGSAAFLACLALGSDWERWRGPAGNGISTESDWKPQALAKPKVLWKAGLGVGHSSVAVAQKKLYTMGNVGKKDHVYCLDAETGKELWRHVYPCDDGNYAGTRATPVLDGELLYTLSREGHAFCLEAATGKVKWQKNLIKDFGAANITWGFAGSPLIHGNKVVYNARASGVALDKATGEKVWVTGAGGGGYASAVPFTVKGKDCLAVFGRADLFVVDAATGEKVASHPWTTDHDVNAADPVVVDGRLFVTSGYNHGCALLDFTNQAPRPVWESREMRGHFASPVYLDGHLYGVDGQTGTGELRCLDAKNGRIKWSERGGKFENLMVAGGRIIAIDSKGVLTIIQASPAKYQELAKAQVLNGRAKNWTAPVLANGLIYCRNADGELVCLDLR